MGDKSLSQLQSRTKAMGDQFVWGTPLLLKPTPFLGFGYGCPGDRFLDLKVCPSSLCYLISETSALKVVTVGLRLPVAPWDGPNV